MQASPGDLGGITRDIVADEGPLILDQGIDLSLVSDGDESIIISGLAGCYPPGERSDLQCERGRLRLSRDLGRGLIR